MKKLFPLVALVCCSLVLWNCQKPEPEPAEDPFGVLTFSLTMPNGQTIECVVDQEAQTITNTNDPIEPGMPASQYVMKINYTATLETTVRLGTDAIETGVTTADFSQPVTIVAQKGEKEITYTITLIEDANDASQTSGKRVNADMKGSGFPNCSWFDIVSFKGEFYAITSTYPDGTAAENPALYDVYKSADGISWSEVNTNIKVVGGYGARLVVFKDKLWAFGGGRFYGTDEDGTAPESMWGMFPDISQLFLCSSPDGANWTVEEVVDESAAVNGYVDARLFVMGDKLVYMGGLGCVFGQIQRSFNMAETSDGVTWTKIEGFASDGPAAMLSCYTIYPFKGKLYLAGGFQNFVDPGSDTAWYKTAVWESSDNGLTWTEAAADGGFGAMWNMRVVGTDDVLYMVGGEYFADGTGEDGEAARTLTASNKIYRSTDGINWTALEGENAMPETYTGRTRPCLVADGDMLWIFGGRGHTNGYYGGPDATDEVILDTWKKLIK